MLERLAETLTARYGRGFSRRSLDDMRRLYLAWPVRQTLSAKSIRRTASAKSEAPTFDLPRSHYVRLLSIREERARAFYETDALRGGWTIRQLSRQVESQFYERTALSKNKAAMLTRGERQRPGDAVTVLHTVDHAWATDRWRRIRRVGAVMKVVRGKSKTARPRRMISAARLAEMIEEATVDAYGEYEQTTGWYTMFEMSTAARS